MCKITKNVKLAEVFCQQQRMGGRFELSNVYVKSNKVVATDSYTLVEFTENKKRQENYLPIEQIKTIKLTDLKEKDINLKINQPADDLNYPDYEQIMVKPTTETHLKVKLNAEFLEKVAKTVKKFKDKNIPDMMMYINKENPETSSLYFEAENDKKEKLKSLLMPIQQ